MVNSKRNRVLAPAWEIEESTYPAVPGKRGMEDEHFYGLIRGDSYVSVMYCREQLDDTNRKFIHISICYSIGIYKKAVTSDIVGVVRELIEKEKLAWPQRFEGTIFEAGIFAGYGIHLWEKP